MKTLGFIEQTKESGDAEKVQTGIIGRGLESEDDSLLEKLLFWAVCAAFAVAFCASAGLVVGLVVGLVRLLR